jgi:hypothetical protein
VPSVYLTQLPTPGVSARVQIVETETREWAVRSDQPDQ